MLLAVPTRIQHGGENEAAPWANTLLIAVHSVVFWLGLSWSLAVGSGTSISSVLTYGFAHAGIPHFVGNMWLLWVFGNAVNRRLGNGYYLLAYLGTVVALGALVRLLCDGYAIGSSGAILAVIAIAVMLLPGARVDVSYVALFPITLLAGLIQKPTQAVYWFLRWGHASLYTFWFVSIVPLIEVWGLWRWKTQTGDWNWTNLVHLLGFVCGIAVVLMLPSRVSMGRENAGGANSRPPLSIGATIALVAVLLAALFFAAGSTHVIKLGKKASAEEIAKAYESQVKYIRVGIKVEADGASYEEKNAAIGTGILVANDKKHGLIVTNRHVVDLFYPYSPEDMAPGAEVTTTIRVQNARERADDDSEELSFEAELAAYHSTQDLALLIVGRKYRRPTTMRVASRRSLVRGEHATAIGNSLGKPYIVSNGNISGFDDGLVLTTCAVSPGNSGGPLFLHRYGLLAGINSASYIIGQNLNLAIPAENILESLETPAALEIEARAEARIERGVAKTNAGKARRGTASNEGTSKESRSGWNWTDEKGGKRLVMKLARMVQLSD